MARHPLGVAAEVVESSRKAVEEAEAAGPGVAANARTEYERVVNDMRAIAAADGVLQRKDAGGGAGDAVWVRPRCEASDEGAERCWRRVWRILRELTG